jgi:hypothetical protein
LSVALNLKPVGIIGLRMSVYNNLQVKYVSKVQHFCRVERESVTLFLKYLLCKMYNKSAELLLCRVPNLQYNKKLTTKFMHKCYFCNIWRFWSLQLPYSFWIVLLTIETPNISKNAISRIKNWLKHFFVSIDHKGLLILNFWCVLVKSKATSILF